MHAFPKTMTDSRSSNVFLCFLKSPVVPVLVTVVAVGGLGVGAMMRPEAEPLPAHEPVAAVVEEVAELEETGPKLVPEHEMPLMLGRSAEEVAVYINRAYRVPMADARQYTQWAIEIGGAQDIDPLLILAVVATESSFTPTAKSRAGAEGLMQVMTKVHAEKFAAFGGSAAALEAYPNMVVGTSILAGLVKRTGSVAKGLKWYSGAARHKTDYGYGAKVLKERSRLAVAALGESDRAVTLSRAKKSTGDYRAHGERPHLGYTQWTSISDSLEASGAAEKQEADAAAAVKTVGGKDARGKAATL